MLLNLEGYLFNLFPLWKISDFVWLIFSKLLSKLTNHCMKQSFSSIRLVFRFVMFFNASRNCLANVFNLSFFPE